MIIVIIVLTWRMCINQLLTCLLSAVELSLNDYNNSDDNNSTASTTQQQQQQQQVRPVACGICILKRDIPTCHLLRFEDGRGERDKNCLYLTVNKTCHNIGLT